MLAQPTPLQLALALTLVRSKPPDLSVREYIHRLRAHITPTARPQFSVSYEESQQKYMNAAFHFKKLWEDEVAKQDGLRNELAKKLAGKDRELERLKFKLIDSDARGEKRKADEPHPEERGGEKEEGKLKRKKTGHGKSSNSDASLKDEESLLSWGDFEAGETLLRHVYDLQKASSSSKLSADSPAVFNTIRHVCRHTRLALTSFLASQTPSNGTRKSSPDAKTFFSALMRITKLLSMAFTRALNDENGSSRETHALTYELTSLFQKLLSHLADSTRLSVSHRPSHRSRSASKESDVCSHVMTLLRTFTSSFFPPQPAKGTNDDSTAPNPSARRSQALKALHEGLLHLLLTRAGELLYTLTFLQARGSDLSSEIPTAGIHPKTYQAPTPTPVPPPSSKPSRRKKIDNLLRNPQIPAEPNPTVQAAELEARCLTPLLRLFLPRTLHGTFLLGGEGDGTDESASAPVEGMASDTDSETDLDTPVRARGARTSGGSVRGAGTGARGGVSLLVYPVERVQGMLIAGMFGSGAGLGELLRVPGGAEAGEDEGVGLEGGSAGSGGVADGVGDFDFAREMWCRVGWDVLARGM